MTFAQYWEQKGHFGSNPEEVAELAWNAAIEAEQATLKTHPWLCKLGWHAWKFTGIEPVPTPIVPMKPYTTIAATVQCTRCGKQES